MNKRVRYSAIASVCIGVLTTYAAARQQYPAPTPATPTGTATSLPAGQTTLVGCLYRESALPGRSAVRGASMLDDYILANAAFASTSAAAGAVGTAGTVPASGKLYEVERIAEEQLSPLVGKRVEITGHIDADPKHLTGAEPDLTDLPEFEAVSIREVSGTCPATPTLQ